jgi:hypothetical protein
MKVLRQSMKLEVLNRSVDHVTRLGKRMDQWPILVKLTSFSVKLEVLKILKT